jgi:hypothetical protein
MEAQADSRGRKRERVDLARSLDSCGTERERVDLGSSERERVAQGRLKGHLPRLAPESYRGPAFVHWTLTIENRTTGWLTETFHHDWCLCLLHTSARYHLACPAYVLMPDHMHLVWLGFRDDSNQLPAIEFLRNHLGSALLPAAWQRQAHDHVLNVEEQKPDAFVNAAKYIFENPVRAGLVRSFAEYPYLSCCVPGYPDLDVRASDCWELFWRIYGRLVSPQRHSLTLAAT